MAIKRKTYVDYRFKDEEMTRTSLVAIGTFDDTVTEAEDNTIFYYFETEEEFEDAVKNGTEEFEILDVF